jgi:hypothetical protein
LDKLKRKRGGNKKIKNKKDNQRKQFNNYLNLPIK